MKVTIADQMTPIPGHYALFVSLASDIEEGKSGILFASGQSFITEGFDIDELCERTGNLITEIVCSA